MHSANHLLQLHHRKLSVTVLSAMLSFASAGSLAAGPGAAAAPTLPNPSLNEKAMNLKLDLGLAMSGDDCEDDYADLMHVAVTSGSSAPAVAATRPVATRPVGIGGSEGLLAKLTPVENSIASATPHVAPSPAVRVAQAVPAAKPVAPVPVALAPAAPVAATLAVPAAPSASSWEVAPADKTLNTTLARWAAVAGWQLLWELPVDYAVGIRTEIRGSFVEAVGLVAKSMETAEIPMKAIFYEGNRVLRIVTKGTE